MANETRRIKQSESSTPFFLEGNSAPQKAYVGGVRPSAHALEHQRFCGVDEAGRGALCGPVVAAAVLPRAGGFSKKVFDSKAISETEREALFALIRKESQSCIAFVSPAFIDRTNILIATLKAMEKAVKGLSPHPFPVLIDGLHVPSALLSFCEGGLFSSPKADALQSAVSAASILAKVARDRYMKRLSKRESRYDFDRHKGYGTALHREKIALYGLSEYHRKTFTKHQKSGRM